MRIKAYAIYDSKTQTYTAPIFQDFRGNAFRLFESVVKGEIRDLQNVAKYPADYTFFEIGEYDLMEGIFVCYEAKINLGTGLDFKSKVEAAENN